MREGLIAVAPLDTISSISGVESAPTLYLSVMKALRACPFFPLDVVSQHVLFVIIDYRQTLVVFLEQIVVVVVDQVFAVLVGVLRFFCPANFSTTGVKSFRIVYRIW